MQTYQAKTGEIDHKWYVVDATDKHLGRLATQIAVRLRGKHKPQYTPHNDTGDHIIVVNAEKIAVTGNKYKDKMYYSHSGYVGHLKAIPFERLIEKHPERIIEFAVKGMMPRNPLGRAMLKKLHVYAGTTDRHHGQQPEALEL
ncbi:MAG: 50S ribosomal protein L13 [Candidatus Oxydemutatoraceae bacterium WSBS_2016_MAG_OTU14]